MLCVLWDVKSDEEGKRDAKEGRRILMDGQNGKDMITECDKRDGMEELK